MSEPVADPLKPVDEAGRPTAWCVDCCELLDYDVDDPCSHKDRERCINTMRNDVVDLCGQLKAAKDKLRRFRRVDRWEIRYFCKSMAGPDGDDGPRGAVRVDTVYARGLDTVNAHKTVLAHLRHIRGNACDENVRLFRINVFVKAKATP